MSIIFIPTFEQQISIIRSVLLPVRKQMVRLTLTETLLQKAMFQKVMAATTITLQCHVLHCIHVTVRFEDCSWIRRLIAPACLGKCESYLMTGRYKKRAPLFHLMALVHAAGCRASSQPASLLCPRAGTSLLGTLSPPGQSRSALSAPAGALGEAAAAASRAAPWTASTTLPPSLTAILRAAAIAARTGRMLPSGAAHHL